MQARVSAEGGSVADNPAKNLRRQYEGKIIFISSIAGLITDPFAGAYSSSKHALEAVPPQYCSLSKYDADFRLIGRRLATMAARIT
ncbi:hypothetical protein A0U89_00455 [Kozakia baliensis]|uniref:Uncharacterized protein n=1 Tax=Kozakia baliensis TaxID=153496 RepID=A0A1D8UQE0_9PROT|nr:hypothetical protein A0U89_00455 [Kozakia baliensis]